MSDKAEHQPAEKAIIDGISTAGGAHCETAALGVLLGHAGLELSEPMQYRQWDLGGTTARQP